MEATEGNCPSELVYNVTVEEYHTYFVGDSVWGFALWAHNKSCDSRKLGKALTDAGEKNTLAGGQAAHVVPTGAFSTRSAQVQKAIQNARDALIKAGIDINSAPNGFWAVKGHNGTHRDAYFLELGEAMVEAMKNGKVAETLNSFRLRALAGAFL